MRILVLCSLLLLSVCAPAAAQGPFFGSLGGSSPTCTPDLTVHPRLFLNACTRSEILSMVNPGGLNATRFQRLVDELNTNWAFLSPCAAQSCPRYALDAGLVYQLYDGLSGVNLHGRSKADFAAKGLEIM